MAGVARPVFPIGDGGFGNADLVGRLALEEVEFESALANVVADSVREFLDTVDSMV